MASSRFIAGRTAQLDARSIPPVENVDRSVAVGIVSVPAMSADEGRLVFAAPAVNCPAGRAGLRSVGGVNLDQAGRLVGEHSLDLMPADVQDRAVEPALLCDVLPRSGNRSGSGSRHVLGAEPLNHGGAVVAGDPSGSFVRPMFADAGNLGLELGNTALGLGVTNGTTLAAGRNTLGFAGLALNGVDLGRQGVSRPIGQHQGNGDTAINANGAAVVGLVAFEQAADGNLPAERCADDSRLTDAAFHVASAAELDPADLGELYAPPAAVDLFDFDLAASKAKGVVNALALGLRITALALPRAAVSLVKVFQGALKRGGVHGPHEINVGTENCQFAGLRHIIKVVTSKRLILPPVVAALLKCEVPHKTAHASKLAESFSLFLRWTQSVCVAAKSHIKLDVGGVVPSFKWQCPAFLPGLKAGVSSGDSQ